MKFNGYPDLQAALDECRHSYVHSDKGPSLPEKEDRESLQGRWKEFSQDELLSIDEDIAALRRSGSCSRGYYVTRVALILAATEDPKMSFYPIRCRDILWVYTGVITRRVNSVPSERIFFLNAVDAFAKQIRFCLRPAAPDSKKNLMEEDMKYLVGKLAGSWPGILWGYSADRKAMYEQDFSGLVETVRRGNAVSSLILCSSDRACTFLIKTPEFLLGRGIDVDGRIGGDPNIGRRHCMIRRKDGEYFIRDLQSLNGTFLNGQRLAPNVDCRLTNGDEIMLCEQKFVVRIVRR